MRPTDRRGSTFEAVGGPVHLRLPRVQPEESRTHGLDRLGLIPFLQVAQTISVHHGAAGRN